MPLCWLYRMMSHYDNVWRCLCTLLQQEAQQLIQKLKIEVKAGNDELQVLATIPYFDYKH
jgi:hypothetical protein